MLVVIFSQQEQSTTGMDTDPYSEHTELQIPQPLNPGILLESVPPIESPPPYSECIQMQFTPYSYYGDETCQIGENQKPIDALRSSTAKFNNRYVILCLCKDNNFYVY